MELVIVLVQVLVAKSGPELVIALVQVLLESVQELAESAVDPQRG